MQILGRNIHFRIVYTKMVNIIGNLYKRVQIMHSGIVCIQMWTLLIRSIKLTHSGINAPSIPHYRIE